MFPVVAVKLTVFRQTGPQSMQRLFSAAMEVSNIY